MNSQDQGFVLEPQAIAMLAEIGVPYPDYRVACDTPEALRIAEQLGYPVVAKIVSPDVVHKSDVGGVKVNLQNADQLASACDTMLSCLRQQIPDIRIEGILVARQANEGIEVIVGALDDLTFGPVVMFGLGGIFSETLKDIAFRLAPIDSDDADEMIREIRGWQLLAGARGKPALDIPALRDLLVKVSRLVASRRDIKELDLNPIRLYQHGLLALDVRLVCAKGVA